MPIFIGADHRGFELKNKLVEYLQEKNIRIEDMGNYQLDPLDDYPDFAKKVAQAVLQSPGGSLGIVICGSGVGACITANKSRGILCGIGFDPEQIQHAREDDHINILSLASDFLTIEKAKTIIDAFICATPKREEKYLRRIRKLENI